MGLEFLVSFWDCFDAKGVIRESGEGRRLLEITGIIIIFSEASLKLLRKLVPPG